MRQRYQPLVDRISDRADLSDLLAQLTAELGALHTYVRGGEMRKGTDEVVPAQLGAELSRSVEAGGYRVDKVYQTDPDEPQEAGPLARPNSKVAVGEIITMVNGQPTLSAPDLGYMLRSTAGQQVLLHVKTLNPAAERDVVVTPIAPTEAEDLRYNDWEYTRRLAVEEQGHGDVGYVHLRAMVGEDFNAFARNFYPVFTRKGLIVDVRHNRGGNIESWVIERLMRKAWFYWAPRVGRPPAWNMQFAFRGHIAVLCDEWTASDGEAFSEGMRRLNLGKVFGTRTWGGEIWLSMDNLLVDNGFASAAEEGVYGPEGQWLIEGHGVEPDVVVDNLPHATFKGEDAQLKAAVEYLNKRIVEQPVEVPPVPAYPDKSFKPPTGN
jgi:tricorn protease